MNMVVIAHPDDEAVWFGGLLPYLIRYKMEKTIVVAMCCNSGHLRAQELRNACIKYGSGIDIEFGGFRDCNLRNVSTNPVTFHIDENFEKWGGKKNVVEYLVYLIQLYKPHNIFTHDINGEGYHSNHVCTAISVREAIKNTNYRVHNVYFHLYNENKIEYDWSIIVNGKSLLQWANEGIQCHISQHCPSIKQNTHLWGSLYKKEVSI